MIVRDPAPKGTVVPMPAVPCTLRVKGYPDRRAVVVAVEWTDGYPPPPSHRIWCLRDDGQLGWLPDHSVVIDPVNQ